MAIARGAGTEIIRSASFYDISNSTNTKLIIGEQHHIYTILSVAIYCISNVSPFTVQGTLNSWDADNSAAADMILFKNTITAGQTFIWNDKISFNGTHPTGHSGQMDTIAKQNLIADQASSTSSYFWIDTGSNSDSCNAFVTYIDQNNV